MCDLIACCPKGFGWSWCHTAIPTIGVRGARRRIVECRSVALPRRDIALSRSCAGECGCPAGSELDDGESCQPCAIGYSKPVAGTHQCTPCAVGTFSALPGAITCALCPVGLRQPNAGQDRCESCPIGQSSAKGSFECSVCDKGYYRATADTPVSECQPCSVLKGDAHTLLPAELFSRLSVHHSSAPLTLTLYRFVTFCHRECLYWCTRRAYPYPLPFCYVLPSRALILVHTSRYEKQ